MVLAVASFYNAQYKKPKTCETLLYNQVLYFHHLVNKIFVQMIRVFKSVIRDYSAIFLQEYHNFLYSANAVPFLFFNSYEEIFPYLPARCRNLKHAAKGFRVCAQYLMVLL